MTHTLSKRTDSGATFSIIFGVIAFLVVLACAIWGFVVPHWRKTHPRPPSRTKWNDGSILTARPKRPPRRILPIHPAIGPLLCRPPAAQTLPTYNPRVESPFPGDMHPKFYEGKAMYFARTNSAPTVSVEPTSNGLFTPTRRIANDDDSSKGRHHTVPRGIDAKHFTKKSTDFGDAKEFILAVPEPLTLRPKDAGRAPAVTKYLERYSIPSTSSPATSDKLPHPNKLFRAVQYGDVRSSLCSSTSLYVDHRESDTAAALAAKEMSDAVDRAIQDGEVRERSFQDQDNMPDNQASSQPTTEDCDTGENNVTALDRLRSYRSLTGSRPPRLEGSIAVKRPAISCNIMKNANGTEVTDCGGLSPSLLRVMSYSTALNSNETSSEQDTISTPATSPTFAPSNLQILPWPLRPARSGDEVSKALRVAELKEEEGPKVCQPTMDGHTTPAAQPLDERHLKISQGFHRANRRRKAAPPGLINTHKYSPSKIQYPRRSLTDISDSVIGPGSLKSRVRASSMYSRDTHGPSLVATPTTPERSSLVIDALVHHDGAGNPFRGRESVRDRIQEWTQRIGGLSSPPLPDTCRTRLKASVSADELDVKRIQEKQGQMTVTPTEATKFSDQTQKVDPPGGKKGVGAAPGGAKWI